MIRKLIVSVAAVFGLLALSSAPAFAYGPTGGTTVAASSTVVAPGGSLTITGSGYAPNESVSIDLHSTPVHLATVSATSSGTFTATVTIPSSTTPGQHTITATGLTSGASASFPITVVGTTTSGVASGSTLPFTGANVGATAAVGAGVLALGGFLVLSTRKRRRSNFTA